ncbi:MAG TPA: type II secretion system protein [Pirellulales bacterium]|nr:type II secretion system protein [Pirellulales bacterium]
MVRCTLNDPGRIERAGVRVAARRGVTLIELLVVIMIMLMITAITIPVIAPSIKNREVREAARMIDVFINGAKTRALQSGHIYGVMIERVPGQPNAAVTLSYCEQPDPYTGDFATPVSFPGIPSGSSGSTILLLGNGGFGAWTAPAPLVPPMPGTVLGPVFPLGDTGWIAGPAPTGTGWITTLAPGDIMEISGKQYRLWAGEPFLDIDQNGICNFTTGSLPGTPTAVQEPFLDVDGSGSWTPPNPPPGQAGNVSGQPYVDPASGYFVQPNVSAGSPFPVITWGSQSAFITYAPYEPVQSAQTIGTGYVNTAIAVSGGGALPTNVIAGPSPPSVVGSAGFSFSFLRRPIKTSAPSTQLPAGAVIDLGANLAYTPPGQPQGNIIPIPGSGIEVLASNANTLGLWATFDCNPLLDPTLNGQITGVPAQSPPPSDTTPIIITFQPSGTVDRVYSWSEIDTSSASGTLVNWSDWQGRIPDGPIYLLVGREELINGDPTLLPLIAQNQAPLKPVYNVQDPSALWVGINPQTGAVATAENVGFDLTATPVPTGTPNFTSMSIYWNANVYYSRRLIRAMLDMGGR